MHALVLLLVLSMSAASVALAQPTVPEVDVLFARWNTTTPGCAAGANVDARLSLTRDAFTAPQLGVPELGMVTLRGM